MDKYYHGTSSPAIIGTSSMVAIEQADTTDLLKVAAGKKGVTSLKIKQARKPRRKSKISDTSGLFFNNPRLKIGNPTSSAYASLFGMNASTPVTSVSPYKGRKGGNPAMRKPRGSSRRAATPPAPTRRVTRAAARALQSSI
jgi:hypothetical protein